MVCILVGVLFRIKRGPAGLQRFQTTSKATNETSNKTSPKVLALIEAISSMQHDEKGVVFSQFTKFLDDIIGDALTDAGICYTRIDGSKSAKERLAAVKSFSSDDTISPCFILCSLRAAGTGINLT